MTLDAFINIWWNSGITYVIEARFLDDVIDAIDTDDDIPKEYIEFCFDPSKAQKRCVAYLGERWHQGTVNGFTMVGGEMCVFVEPYRKDGK